MREYTTVDKSTWGDGPWQTEPDKIQWIDEATGLDCLMHRGPMGAWCGYVGVTEGHPAFGVGYGSVDELDVHGGLTYADFCRETSDESKGICHVPEPGRPARVWWLGFDCAHYDDRQPRMEALDSMRGYTALFSGTVYRDRAYVENEVRSLAQQLKAQQ